MVGLHGIGFAMDEIAGFGVAMKMASGLRQPRYPSDQCGKSLSLMRGTFELVCHHRPSTTAFPPHPHQVEEFGQCDGTFEVGGYQTPLQQLRHPTSAEGHAMFRRSWPDHNQPATTEFRFPSSS